MFQTIILPAISLGLSATSIPGPLQAYLLNTTLRYGWRRGILVIFAPLVVDGPVILVTVFLLGQLPDIALQIIRVLGGLLLLWIAWGAWKQFRAGTSFTAAESGETSKGDISPRRVFGTAVAMNVLSPGPYLFWATVTGPLLLKALDISAFAAAGMLLGFYGTFLGGLALLVLVFNRLGTIGPAVTRYLLMATMALLVWFGTGLIAEAFGLAAVHGTLTLLAVLAAALYGGYHLLLSRKRQLRHS